MTKPLYEIIIDEETNRTTIKRIDSDGKEWFIPKDEANSDYQRYLNPEAEQSTPNLP
jgi:hypothetical protein